MRKLCNVVLIALFGLFLLGPFSLVLCENIGISLPAWLTVENANNLSGSISRGDIKASLCIEGYKSRELQKACETEIANYIPCKAIAMLDNAAIQRTAIVVANSLFGFRAYPAYYSANTSIVPADELIVPTVSTISQNNTDAAELFVSLINRMADENPETRFVYDQLDDDAGFNPTSELSSRTYDYQWIEDHVFNLLNTSRVTVLYDPVLSYDEYRTEWFKTERHWKLSRALQTYDRIARHLELAMPDMDAQMVEVTSEWYGSRSRFGLYFGYHDEFYDYPFDFSFIEWRNASGNVVPSGIRDSVLDGSFSYFEHSQPIYQVYDVYYGSVTTEAYNHGANNGKTCLVITTSYGRALKNYIASNYRRTIFIGPNNDVVSTPLADYFSEGIDDVIILLECKSYAGMVSKSPSFFEEA